MKLLLLRYASALAIVLVAFGTYALLAVPRIEPVINVIRSQGGPRESETDRILKQHRVKFAHLFSEGSWQLQEPKVLETEHGTLLFKDYKPLDDGRMELKPLTLILYTGKSVAGRPPVNARPLILDAPDGAMLQFDSTTDPARADFGRLVGGLLVGEIKIHSPPTTSAANDAIAITTRNVQLDERRVWTPHEVDFRYGPSYGSGRDLVITLLSPEGEGKSRGPSVEGVKSLELVHLDKLHLESAGDALLPGKQKPKTEENAKQPPPPAPVEITCQGPFLCDFVEHVASFEDAVEVLRLNPNGPSDRLTCQLLSIFMQPKKLAAASTFDRKPKQGALEVDRVVAVGHPVVLEAPSMGATARGERMEYHLQTRRIVLDDRDRVMLLDERFDIEAKQLEYRLAENGRIGQLWAAGPGRLRARQVEAAGTKTGASRLRPPITPIAARPDPNKPSSMEATWTKELRLRPYKGQHVVSLLENASVGVAQIGGFSADEIHLWLNELPTTGKPATSSSHMPSGGKLQLEPDRMLATGRVQIRATQLDGETGRLEVWFRNVPPPPAGAAAAPAGEAGTPATPANSPLAKPAKPKAPTEPGQKFNLVGDVVRIQLARKGQETTLDEVSVDGHVKLWDQPLPGASPQMVIDGDALQLRGGMEASAVVRVFGEPASISAQGMTLRGSNVNLHRAENRLWIEGAGDMELPLSNSIGGEKLDKPTNVLVTWQRGLDFDGTVARFNGNVEVQTANRLQWARGDALDVTMNQKIDFAQAKPGMKPEVAHLAFEGNFALENHSLDKQGQLASIDKMQAENLHIDQQSGRMEAAGPGWVSSIRLGGAANPLTDRGLAARPVSNKTNESPQFSYLFVEFQLQIVGNLFQHQVEFQRHVRAVYGPVASWRDTLNIDQRPEQLNEQTVLMECQRLELREMPGSYANATTIEMEATGDTVVEGKGFTARAARIGYQDEKQLLVLEGDGRQDAELTRQTKIGGPQSHLKSRKIKYWKYDNRVEFDDARMLELNQLQELKPPKR